MMLPTLVAASFTRSQDRLPAVAGVLAEVAVALQDPSPSSGFQLLRLPSPCQCCGSTRHHLLVEEPQLRVSVLLVGQFQVVLGLSCHLAVAAAQSTPPLWSCPGCDSSPPTGQSSHHHHRLRVLHPSVGDLLLHHGDLPHIRNLLLHDVHHHGLLHIHCLRHHHCMFGQGKTHTQSPE